MVKYYRVCYSAASKKMDEEKQQEILKLIEALENVKTATLNVSGQILGIDAEIEHFPAILNSVVNIFRRHDAKSEVTYEFELNKDN